MAVVILGRWLKFIAECQLKNVQCQKEQQGFVDIQSLDSFVVGLQQFSLTQLNT